MNALLRALLLTLMLFAAFGLTTLSGCEEPGPAEEAGEEIDDAADEMTDEMDGDG